MPDVNESRRLCLGLEAKIKAIRLQRYVCIRDIKYINVLIKLKNIQINYIDTICRD